MMAGCLATLVAAPSYAAVVTQQVSITVTETESSNRFASVQRFDPGLGEISSVEWLYTVTTTFSTSLENAESSDRTAHIWQSASTVIGLKDYWPGGNNFFATMLDVTQAVPAGSIVSIADTQAVSKQTKFSSSFTGLMNEITGLGAYEWGFFSFGPQAMELTWSTDTFPFHEHVTCQLTSCVATPPNWTTVLDATILYNYRTHGEVALVPEPGTILLMIAAGIGLMLGRTRGKALAQ